MKRILLTVEYDGTNYAGWQRQINGLAVQQVLEEALQKATKERIVVTGASRTDAGVHALGQAVHFDTESRIPPEKYPFVLNTIDTWLSGGCPYVIFALLMAVLVIFKHRDNIKRLRQGKENKFSFKKSVKSDETQK